MQRLTDECDVCCERMNKSTRKAVKCDFCDFVACKVCASRYLLESTEDPHCMNCRKGWTREVMISKFASTFVNGKYKKHREEILYNREVALLPATQPLAEEFFMKMKLKVELAKVRIQVWDLKDSVKELEEVLKLKPEIQQIQREIEKYEMLWDHTATADKQAHKALLVKKRNLEKTFSEKDEILKTKKVIREMTAVQKEMRKALDVPEGTKERRAFVCPCPQEECRGFLSTQYKCGLCGINACKDCLEILSDDDHKCDSATAASHAEIKKSTMPCPKCSTRIFKISGCDQMFCVQCHTAFSWVTGRVETGVVHNPHYFQWLRQTEGSVPRNPLDGCRMPFDQHLIEHLRRHHDLSDAFAFLFVRVIHIREVELLKLTEDRVASNQDIRIQYLTQKISQTQFKTKLQRAEKKRELNGELHAILSTYVDVMTDIIQGRGEQLKDKDEDEEISNIIHYTMNQFNILSNTFNVTNNFHRLI